MQTKHKIIKITILFSIAVVIGGFPVNQASAAGLTYYVATNGNDNNSCATAQNINTPKRTLNNAVTCLTAGDMLLVRGGTYTESLYHVIPPGLPGSPVTLRSYLGEKVIINASPGLATQLIVFLGQRENWASYGIPQSVYSTYLDQYITLDGLTVDGNYADGSGLLPYNDIKIYGADGIVVKNSELTGTTGVPLQGNGDNLTFQNLDIHDYGQVNDYQPGGGASYVSGNNLLFENSRIHDCTNCSGLGIWNGGGFQTTNGNAVVRNNIIYNVHRNGIGAAAGAHNGYGIYCGNALGPMSCLVYNNIVYDSDIGIAPVYNSYNSQLYNNTVADTTYGPCVYATDDGGATGSPAVGTVIKNNICWQNARGFVSGGASYTESNNLISANPLFIDAIARDFRLQSNSPAINTAITIPLVMTDFLGVPRPVGCCYDIGAYEYTGGVTPPPPPPPSPPSPSGTRVPPSSSITDNGSNTWTLGSGISPFIQILRNGAQAVSAYGAQILWYQNSIYIQGDNYEWYIWNGNGFNYLGPNDPSGVTPLLGDLNLDHIVNSLDWSIMNSRWFTSDPTADLNHDGLVNAIDFSLLNANWFRTW